MVQHSRASEKELSDDMLEGKEREQAREKEKAKEVEQEKELVKRENMERFIAKMITEPTRLEKETIEKSDYNFRAQLDKNVRKKKRIENVKEHFLPRTKISETQPFLRVPQVVDQVLKEGKGNPPNTDIARRNTAQRKKTFGFETTANLIHQMKSAFTDTKAISNMKDQQPEEVSKGSQHFKIQDQSTALSQVLEEEVVSLKWYEHIIIYPDNSFKMLWDIFLFMIVIYFAISVPLELGFAGVQPHLNEQNPVLNAWFTAIFSIDIVLNFITAMNAQDSDILIISHKAIIRAYAKTWFLVDLISTLPISSWIGDG